MRSELTIFLVALLVGGSLAWWFKPAEIIDRTDYQQEKIDSLTTVIRNRMATAESLRDSLAETSEAFQEYIRESDREIATLTTIRGRLELRIDSLQDSLATSNVPFVDLDITAESGIADTTITRTATFGNGLIMATSNNIFQDNQFRDDLSIQQLRDIRIDLALLVSDDRRTVESIATSQDLSTLNVSAQTEIKPPKRKVKWWQWLLLGAIIPEGVDAIFN